MLHKNKHKEIERKPYKIGILDIIVLFSVIVNVAINDNLKLLVIAQIVSFAVGLFHICKNRYLNGIDARLLLRVSLYFIWGYISIIWAINAKEVKDYTISNGQIIMMTLVMVAYVTDKTRLHRLMWFFIISAFVLSYRLLTTTSLSSIYTIGYHLGFAFSYDRAHIGMIPAYAVIFLVYFSDIYNKKILYLPMLFLAFISLASGSRKGLIIIVFGVILYLRYREKMSRKQFRTIIMLTIMAIISYYIILNNSYLYYAIGRRVFGFWNFLITGEGDSSAHTRSILLKESINVAINNPIIGVGLYNFKHISTQNLCAHNNYLELICSTGIIGWTIFYYLPIRSLLSARAIIKENKNPTLSLGIALLGCILICDLMVVSYAMEYVQILLNVAMIIILKEFHEETSSI